MNVLRDVQRYESRFWSRVDFGGDCWTWRGVHNGRRYGQMHVGAERMALCHRISWTLVYGPIPNGMEVMHRCDNPACVKPSHLALGSHAENMADAGRKGILPRGSRHHWRRISESKALEVKRAIASGMSRSNAARACGVAIHYAYDIAAENSWRHLEVK